MVLNFDFLHRVGSDHDATRPNPRAANAHVRAAYAGGTGEEHAGPYRSHRRGPRAHPGVREGRADGGGILLPIAFILGIVSLFMKNKKKGMSIAAIIISVVGAVLAPIVFFAYITDAADEALNAPPTQTGPDGTTIENKGKDAQGTSRDNPLPVGSSVESKEWSYKINSIELNGTDAVLAANPFNDAPADGQQYILINVTATYTGNDPEGSIPLGTVAYVSADGNTFAAHDSLAVAPDAFDQITTLYEGASTTGNIAIAVPSEGIENGVLAVSPDMFSGKSFVAVQ